MSLIATVILCAVLIGFVVLAVYGIESDYAAGEMLCHGAEQVFYLCLFKILEQTRPQQTQCAPRHGRGTDSEISAMRPFVPIAECRVSVALYFSVNFQS